MLSNLVQSNVVVITILSERRWQKAVVKDTNRHPLVWKYKMTEPISEYYLEDGRGRVCDMLLNPSFQESLYLLFKFFLLLLNTQQVEQIKESLSEFVLT